MKGVRHFGSSSICRACDPTDGKKLDGTASIVSDCRSEDSEKAKAYFEKKYDSIVANKNDTKMLDKLCDQRDKVLYIIEYDNLGNDRRSNIKAWLDGLDPDNFGDPNKSGDSENSSDSGNSSDSDNSSNSNDSTRLPQDSSDVTQTEFNSFEPFDE